MSYNLRTSSDNKEIITISTSSSNSTSLADDATNTNKASLRKRQNTADSKLQTSKKTLQKSTSRSRSSSKSPSRQQKNAAAAAAAATTTVRVSKRKSPTRIAKSSRVVTKRELDDAKKDATPDIIEITTTKATTTKTSTNNVGGDIAARRTRSRSSNTNNKEQEETDSTNKAGNISTESTGSNSKGPRASVERLKNEIRQITSGAATRVLNALENNLNLIDSPAVIQSSSLQQANNPHRYDLRLRANNTPTKSIQQQAPVHNSTPHGSSRSSIVIESKRQISPGGTQQSSNDHHYDGEANNKSLFKYSGYLRYTNRNLLQIFIASIILILLLIFASGYYHEQITQLYVKGRELFKDSIEKTKRYISNVKQ